MNWERWNWEQLLGQQRDALASGTKIVVPRHFGPLANAGFRPTSLASQEGQASDWALSRPDGSRIHVHVYKDGRRVAHRDKFDPDRGIGPALAHLTLDTPYVAIALVVGLLFASSSTSG
jgi:hypothetical protein